MSVRTYQNATYTSHVAELQAVMHRRAKAAALAVARQVVADSQVPLRDGDLTRTGKAVTSPEKPTRALAQWVGVPYAHYQYDDGQAAGRSGVPFEHPGGGESHWAEKAADRNSEVLRALAARKLKGDS